MALTFEQVIAGAPPTGGDSGSEVARKINDNFNQLSEVDNATKHLLSTSTANLYGLSGAGANADNALSKITAPTLLQTYSTAGTFTYTVPAGVTRITAVIGGGGGGGGTVDSNYQTYGGGGGGGYITTVSFSVTQGQNLPIVVGVGGAGSAYPSGDALNGGSSSVNGFVSEGGGKGNNSYYTGVNGGGGSANGGSSGSTAGGAPGSGLNQLRGLGALGCMNLVTREKLGAGGGAGAGWPGGAGLGGISALGNGGNGGAAGSAGGNGASCCGGGGSGGTKPGGSGGAGYVALYAVVVPMGM